MFKNTIIIIFFILFNFNLFADSDIDQWKDTDKTYKDLINEGFEVKAYDTITINRADGITVLFFITVLQKDTEVFECQEYQTLDLSFKTLDLSFVCRKNVQPYKRGVGT